MEKLQKRDIVIRRGASVTAPSHGIVIHTFSVTERDAGRLPSAPVQAGQYAVVSWRRRRRLRAEPAADLVKVGVLEAA